jgi:hypothetical protein
MYASATARSVGSPRLGVRGKTHTRAGEVAKDAALFISPIRKKTA